MAFLQDRRIRVTLVLAVITIVGLLTGAVQRMTRSVVSVAHDFGVVAKKMIRGNAKWTIMVYMDADHQGISTLEQAAFCDFYDMARVGSRKDIRIVVQLERPGDFSGNIVCTNNKTYIVPKWKGTARFLVEKDMKPEVDRALGPIDHQENMADPDAFEKFLDWAIDNFPAEHYALIFFNHGDGVSTGIKPGTAAYLSFMENWLSQSYTLEHHHHHDHPLEFVTSDDGPDGNKLFVTDVQDRLTKVLKRKNPNKTKLDIIGFDACFMGMIENAYAMRDVSEFMVASEEPVPPGGWDYYTWLSRLVTNPTLKARELAWDILDGFAAAHRNDNTYPSTDSVVDLSQMKPLAVALDEFVVQYKTHRRELADNHGLIARRACPSRPSRVNCDYGSGAGEIDLGFFLDHLLELEQQQTHDTNKYPQTLEKSRLALDVALQAALPANYSTEDSRMQRGSTGLAIYFPNFRSDYINEQERGLAGYGPRSKHRSSFDKEHSWTDFLNEVWQISSHTRSPNKSKRTHRKPVR